MVLNYLLKIKGRVMKSPSKGTVPNEPSHLLEMLNRHGFMCETSVICEPVTQIFIHRFWQQKCWKRPNILNRFSLYPLSLCLALPTVQVGSSGYSGITGGTVTLVCSIISSNPSATSVIWEKDVNGVPTDVTTLMASRISGSTVTQPSLTISSLTAGDTGTYYCSAANSVGRGSRSSTTLTVQSKFPTAVDHLKCMLYILDKIETTGFRRLDIHLINIENRIVIIVYVIWYG